MNRDKQIEEMTKIIWDNPNMYDLPSAEDVAFELYDAGYRKASDVAREIMQEVRQTLLSMVLANSIGKTFDTEKRFAEIEKKYESEGADDE